MNLHRPTILLALLAAAAAACSAPEPSPDEPIESVSSAATTCANALVAKAATASSVENNNLPASNAIDGKTTTRWSSLAKDGEWITVDYGQSVFISDLTITWQTAYASTYSVQIGKTATGPWTNVYTKTAFAGGVDHTTGLTAVGQFLHVVGTKRATGFGISIWEIAALGSTTPASCTTTACTPKATQCASSSSYQTCAANGTWGTATACSNQACVAGKCAGVCKPGATQCSLSKIQTCDATGNWGTPTGCGGASSCVNSTCQNEVAVVGAPVLATQSIVFKGPWFTCTDTLAANGSGQVSFDMGDGTPALSGTLPSSSTSSGFYLKYTYAKSGTFTMTATVTNTTTGATAKASYPVTVTPSWHAAITEFPLPAPMRLTTHITSGGIDGKLYITDVDGYVGTITTAGVATVTADPLFPNYLLGIAKGADGNMWITEQDGDNLVQWTPGTTTFNNHQLFPAFSAPQGIVLGPDQKLWVTLAGSNQIAWVKPSVGQVGYSVLDAPTPSSLGDIVAGPDGNLWFVETSAGRIGSISTAGTFGVDFAVSTIPNSGPYGLAASADGLWYTLNTTGRIGHYNIATKKVNEISWLEGNGLVSEIGPRDMVIDGSGNLWFTEAAGYVGRVTPAGVVTEFPLPSPNTSNPTGIAIGPDNNVWFLDGNKVDRITP